LHLPKVMAVSIACLPLVACSSIWRPAPPSTDYVEVDNPYITMTKDAPAKIWVPRSSVEGGVPRATEAVKMGVDKVMSPKTPPPAPQPAPASPVAAASAATPSRQPQLASAAVYSPAPVAPAVLRHRVVILEIGQNDLVQPLQEQVKRCGIAIVADPSQATYMARSAQLTTPEGKGSFAVRLQQEYNVNEVIFVSASGLGPGKGMTAEVYDTMGGGLLRGIDAVVPQYKESDPAAKTAAVAEALSTITAGLKELFPNLPWYSRISAVNGNRAYIAAGKEAGLRVGQTLKIYRGGKFMKGLGFAPGSKIGALEVDGFIGPNAAFCGIRDGQGIEAGDVVSSE